ncbi:hypothetical protein IV102_22355 [bacterium]|nr:hypothetical protein [bacterium]
MINTGQNTLRFLQAQSYPLAHKPAVVPEKTPLTEAKDAVQLSNSVPLPTLTETRPQAEGPKIKEATGDMALMLESMERAQERSQQAGDDLLKGVQLDLVAQRGSGNSPIAVLDWGSAPNPEHSPHIDGFLATLVQIEQDKQAAIEKEKVQPEPNHGLLGGHLSIEGGEHIAHELVNVKTHAVSAAVDAKAHIATQVVSDAADAAVSQGSHVVKKAAAHHAETGEAAGHAMSGFVTGLTGALAGASGILGIVMLAVGIGDIKHGAKHGDKEHVVEGINHVVVGTRSLAAGTSMAGHILHGSEILTSVAGIAKTALLPLGVAHGAIDAGLGAKQVYDGIKAKDAGKVTKGSLGVGLGLSLIAAAAGGGVPALVAAGVFLTGKIAHGIHQRRADAEH